MSEIAHLGPVELLTPKAQESLGFFVDVLGMEEEGREGASVYLRGWGDYQRYSLKLIASDTSGMGVLGLRAVKRNAPPPSEAGSHCWLVPPPYAHRWTSAPSPVAPAPPSTSQARFGAYRLTTW